MVTIELVLNNTALMKLYERWFCERPARLDAVKVVRYFRCASQAEFAGFHRTPRHTKLIDLQQTEDQLLAGFRGNTRYEINRAGREGISATVGTDMDQFRSFYDQFCKIKNRPPSTLRGMTGYWPHLVVTIAGHRGEPLVMHSYLADPQTGRACFLHSASHYRAAEDAAVRNLAGRANRYLHFQDMLLLKRRGFAIYDLGGYAVQSTDPELLKINQFKDSFGGDLIAESDYESLPIYLLRRTKSFFGIG